MRLFTTAALLMMFAPTAVAADTYQDRLSTRHQARTAPPATQASYSVPAAKANRIVVYSASWCGACRRLKPVLASLKQEGYTVVYRSVEKNPDQLKFSYTALPTIYFLSGESLVKKEVGYRTKAHIKKSLVREPKAVPLAAVYRMN
jgi:thioredoxin 1